jgi:hypothetical protein
VRERSSSTADEALAEAQAAASTADSIAAQARESTPGVASDETAR